MGYALTAAAALLVALIVWPWLIGWVLAAMFFALIIWEFLDSD